MSKIALCIYMCGKVYQSLDHLGLSSLNAVMVENGDEVRQFHIYDEDEDLILNKIIQYNPQYLGFTIYAANIADSLRFIGKLKKRNHHFQIIFGGPTPTYEPEKIIEQENDVDFVVKGEGELTLPDLINRLNKGDSLLECKGICWKDENGLVINNKQRELLDDLDQLPIPERLDEKLSNNVHFNIESSRGCTANCSFCNSKYSRVQYGKAWRGKSIDFLMNEIENSISRYNVNRFNIVDLSFEDPGIKGIERLEEFVRQVNERDLSIKFTAHFRAEFLRETNMELIEKLIGAGLTKASLGIEAGNENSLKVYNKIASVEDNKRAIKLLSVYKIPMIHGFINFNPYVEFDDLINNADFLLECGWAYRIEDFCSRVEIFPGTPLKERLIRDKLMNKDFSYRNDLIDYQFKNEKAGWLSDLLYGLLKRSEIDIDFGLYSESFMFEIKQFLEKNDIPSKIHSDFGLFVDKYFDIIKTIGKNHYDFFISAVEAAKKSSSFPELENRYLELENRKIGNSINVAHTMIEEMKLRLLFKCKRNGVDLSKQIFH